MDTTAWISTLKDQGFTDEQLRDMFTDLSKLSATAAYTIVMSVLTKEDVDEAEKIQDDKEGEEFILKRFQERTGMSLVDYITSAQDNILEDLQKQSASPQVN
jgi:hypothetical protein